MKTIASLLAILALGAGTSCSAPPTDGRGKPEQSRPLLTFTVEGGGLGTATFGPGLSDVDDHWVYDPSTGQTQIHIAGSQGDQRVGIDFVVPLSGPGRYRANTSYKGIDRAFVVALADPRTGERIALVGVDAEIEVEASDRAAHILTGTFAGRFAVGRRTTGTDVLTQRPEQRTYATIEGGRFRLRFRDTLHGRGRLWPGPSGP